MDGLNDIPEWLGKAVIGALLAVMGYCAKWVIDTLKQRRRTMRERAKSLHLLATLLAESKSIFLSQNYQARRLLMLLKQNHSEDMGGGRGFDEQFARLHEKFDDEEHELQSLIRSTTMNSQRRVNEELQAWIRENRPALESSPIGDGGAELLKELDGLALHLNQWHDKYAATIPNDERRSLVYLDDEKHQGNGFPKGLEPALKKILSSQ